MTAQHKKRVRCVIYTRVSTEFDLEQDFNALDAQRDAAEAHIRSQVHEMLKVTEASASGWSVVTSRRSTEIINDQAHKVAKAPVLRTIDSALP